MTAAALSTNEMLAVLGSRALKDGQTVFTGVGAPMLATALAQRRHAPRLTMVVEGGIVGPQWRPGWLPIATNEIRAAYRELAMVWHPDRFPQDSPLQAKAQDKLRELVLQAYAEYEERAAVTT